MASQLALQSAVKLEADWRNFENDVRRYREERASVLERPQLG